MSKITRDILSGTAAQPIIFILGLVATRFIYRSLGDDVLGLLYFSFTLQAVIQQAAITGISLLVIQQIATHAKVDADYVDELVVTSFTLHLLIAVVLAGAAWLISPWLVDNWLQIQSVDRDTALLMLRILMVGIFAMILAPHYYNILRGYEDIIYTNLIQVVVLALRQFGIIVLIYLGANTVGIATWVLVVLIFNVVVLAWRVRRLLHLPVLSMPRVVKSVLQRNSIFGRDMMLLTLVNVLVAQFDKIVLSRLLPVGVLGYYSFLQNTIERSRFIRSAIGTATLPRQAAIGGQGDIDKVNNVHRMLVDLNMFGLAPVYAAVGLALAPLLTFTFSAEIARQLIVPSISLTLSAYISGIVLQSHQTAIALGQGQLSRRAYTIAFLVTIPLAVVSIYYFGIAGAGVAYLMQQVIRGLLLIPPFYRICMQRPRSAWLPHYLRGTVFTVTLYGAAFALAYWLNSGLGGLTLIYLVTSALYALLAWRMLDNELQSRLLAIVTQAYRFAIEHIRITRPHNSVRDKI